jgi:hypothetical protein
VVPQGNYMYHMNTQHIAWWVTRKDKMALAFLWLQTDRQTDRQTEAEHMACYYTESRFKGRIKHYGVGAVIGRCAAIDVVRSTVPSAALKWHRVLKSGWRRRSLCRNEQVSRFSEEVPCSVEHSVFEHPLQNFWHILETKQVLRITVRSAVFFCNSQPSTNKMHIVFL